MRYVGGVAKQHDAYGYRLRAYFGFDQLARAAQALSNDPQIRQVVLQYWDSGADFPQENGSPADPNIPCNVMSMLKIRSGRLEWTQILRSNDFFRGTPYNFFQFTTLQELVAGWTHTLPGTYTHISDSLHVYERELQLIRQPSDMETWQNTDALTFNMNESFKSFDTLEQAVVEISQLTQERGLLEFGDRSLPPPLINFLRIFVAERLRQLRFHEAARGAAERCTNPYLIKAWFAWAAHLRNTPKAD